MNGMIPSRPITMDLGDLPCINRWLVPTWMGYLNKLLCKLGSPVDLKSRFDYREDMISMEQVANLKLLVLDTLDRNISGAFVELGCYMGSSTCVFARLLGIYDPQRPLHVFDRFDIELGTLDGIRERFEENMRNARVAMPVIHTGDLLEMVPVALPTEIAFVHIDLGVGGDSKELERTMEHALSSTYPRLASGGIMALMDYHVAGITMNGRDCNPGVRIATDAFMADKPEQIHLLYGGPTSHAYFRKL